jgi:hypothetical protein
MTGKRLKRGRHWYFSAGLLSAMAPCACAPVPFSDDRPYPVSPSPGFFALPQEGAPLVNPAVEPARLAPPDVEPAPPPIAQPELPRARQPPDEPEPARGQAQPLAIAPVPSPDVEARQSRPPWSVPPGSPGDCGWWRLCNLWK